MKTNADEQNNQYIYINAFLAFVISIIVVIFLPPIFNKYNAEITRSWTIDKKMV